MLIQCLQPSSLRSGILHPHPDSSEATSQEYWEEDRGRMDALQNMGNEAGRLTSTSPESQNEMQGPETTINKLRASLTEQ